MSKQSKMSRRGFHSLAARSRGSKVNAIAKATRDLPVLGAMAAFAALFGASSVRADYTTGLVFDVTAAGLGASGTTSITALVGPARSASGISISPGITPSGMPAMNFSGAGTGINLSAYTGNASGITVFTVESTTGTGDYNIIGAGFGRMDYRITSTKEDTLASYDYELGPVQNNTNVSTGAFDILTANIGNLQNSGAPITYRLNGAPDGGGTANNAVAYGDIFAQVGYIPGEGEAFKGNIAELRVYSGNLTTAQCAVIEAQLAATYTSSANNLFYTGNSSGTFDTSAADNFVNPAGTTATQFTATSVANFQDVNLSSTTTLVANNSVSIQAGGLNTSGGVEFNNYQVNYTLSDADGVNGLSGTGGIYKTGTGTATLLGSNSFTGPVTITGGTLVAGVPGALGSSSGVTVNLGTLQIQGGVTIPASMPITLAGGNIVSASGNNAIASAITGGVTGTTSLTVNGGTLLLSGSNTYTGPTYVNNGTVTYNTGSSTGNDYLFVGNASATNSATLNLNSPGNFTFANYMDMGTVGSGAINQTAGTVTFNTIYGYMRVGVTGYGAYTLSGASSVLNAGNATNEPGGIGIALGTNSLGSFTQTGGTLSTGTYFYLGSASGAAGVATFTGGTANIGMPYGYDTVVGNVSGGYGNLNLGTEAGGNAVYNDGVYGTRTTGAVGLVLGRSGAGSVVNIDAGTMTFNGAGIKMDSGGIGTLNLNGGVLQTGFGTAGQDLTTGSYLISGVNSPTVLVYNGGANFNVTGSAVTAISANLTGAAGSGVYISGGTIPVSAGSGGSGYIGAPLVVVSGGGGSGVTAIANVSGGVITGVTITNPGQNYSGGTMTFAFLGGGATVAASSYNYTLNTATGGDLTLNSGGGLTKYGTGTLLLSGSNTYTGSTKITAGTLRVTSLGAAVAVANPSFQATSAGSSGYTYNPTGAGFTFTGQAGITNGGGFNINGTPPDGTNQVGFVQTQGSISQVLTFPTTTNYIFSFYAEQRNGNNSTAQSLILENDGYSGPNISNGSFTPGTNWSSYTFVFPETAGTHNIIFQGLGDGISGHDNTALIDTLAVNAAGGTSMGIPAASPVVISDNATLDLNNSGTSVGSLTGTSLSAVTMGSLGTGNLITGSFDSGSSTIFSGTISGAGSLTKIGTGNQVLNGVNNYSGGTVVSGGRLVFGASGALPYFTSLNVSGGVAVAATYNGSSTSRNSLFVSSLVLSGTPGSSTSLVDLKNNDLVVRGGVLSDLTNEVAQGYNAAGGGNWQGSGGITSSAAASASTHLMALGVAQNSADGTTTGTPLYTTFDGQTVANTDVLVKYTYFGDANLDGIVDGSDYSRIDSTFLNEQTAGPISGWYNGDFNYDGVVDGSDYTLIDNAFNTEGGALPSSLTGSPLALSTAQIGGTSAVPEPATLSLLAIGAAGLLGRRRRRSN